jgi:hypothetical protein
MQSMDSETRGAAPGSSPSALSAPEDVGLDVFLENESYRGHPLHVFMKSLLLQNHLVDVAPAPVLARLDRLHDGMLGTMKMLRGMFIFGGIAATHVSANQAHAEMHPGVAHFQAFLASVSAWLHLANFFYVRAAVYRHPVLLVRRRFFTRLWRDVFDRLVQPI